MCHWMTFTMPWSLALLRVHLNLPQLLLAMPLLCQPHLQDLLLPSGSSCMSMGFPSFRIPPLFSSTCAQPRNLPDPPLRSSMTECCFRFCHIQISCDVSWQHPHCISPAHEVCRPLRSSVNDACNRRIISLYLLNILSYTCRVAINSFYHSHNLRSEIRWLCKKTTSFLFRITHSFSERHTTSCQDPQLSLFLMLHLFISKHFPGNSTIK